MNYIIQVSVRELLPNGQIGKTTIISTTTTTTTDAEGVSDLLDNLVAEADGHMIGVLGAVTRFSPSTLEGKGK